MIKTYFKQAWQLLKESKLYSTVYIVGTGLSIAMIMVVAIIYYVKIAPFYPETNRNRTMRIKLLNVKYIPDGMHAAYISRSFITDYLAKLESVEAITGVLQASDESHFVEHQSTEKQIPVILKYTDTSFWKVFGFEFVNGRPFSEEEFQSGVRSVVISANLANRIFNTIEAEGQRIIVDADEYRVAGVVRDASYATPETYAQIWMPYTLRPELANLENGEGFLGRFMAYILVPSVSAKGRLEKEAAEMFMRINNSQDKYILDPSGQPEPMWKTYLHFSDNQDIDWLWVFVTFGVILLALLLVPAVNLAGMVSSRMEKRMAELGIRKVFGASRGTLVNQVLIENFLLTFLGGLVGLIISWIIVYSGRYWIFTLFDKWPDMPPEGVDNILSVGMIFNPGIFVVALLVCLLLNFLSALIPAWNGMKKDIVYSINENA